MSSTQPERPMILGNCISCNGLMRVPVTTDVTHVARCPHCETGFPVQQLIASAIPAAEIIEGEVAQDYTPVVDRVRETNDDDSAKPRSRFQVPKQLYNGAKFRRRRRRRSRGSDERKEQAEKEKERPGSSRSRINPSSVPLASTHSASAQPASTQPASSQSTSTKSSSSRTSVIDEVPNESSRSRSRSSSSSDSSSSDSRSSRSQSSSRRSSSRKEPEDEPDSVLEWLKIAVGGIIAFPLAYLCLMWIVGLDPFGLAPTINKVVPFAVPSSLVDDDTLPLPSEFDDIDSEINESLPMPSIDPDDIRG